MHFKVVRVTFGENVGSSYNGKMQKKKTKKLKTMHLRNIRMSLLYVVQLEISKLILQVLAQKLTNGYGYPPCPPSRGLTLASTTLQGSFTFLLPLFPR